MVSLCCFVSSRKEVMPPSLPIETELDEMPSTSNNTSSNGRRGEKKKASNNDVKIKKMKQQCRVQKKVAGKRQKKNWKILLLICQTGRCLHPNTMTIKTQLEFESPNGHTFHCATPGGTQWMILFSSYIKNPINAKFIPYHRSQKRNYKLITRIYLWTNRRWPVAPQATKPPTSQAATLKQTNRIVRESN
ncbi:uncharacterized protein LOC117576363 [Drosophila albomicans]|uniref:Uncharacterized protein LOC117576363 n=1 Tax=Drosophila albomicans TaxID=7291 RepID=A0A6P8XUA1_DROAB|nr:uncharacterized protein LOC117576363 [Drosophila albomicans]